MIDVVFVIMLFFMVMAGAVKVEKSHTVKLPSPPTGTEPVAMPDEIAIRIDDEGQVYLNEEPQDAATVKALPELTASLDKLKSASQATNSEILVTLNPDEGSKYERVIDVLDSLSRAKINKVTFQAGASE